MTTMTIGRESYDGKLYLTCAETAKLLRGELKKTFPGIKFSVRSDTYAGGASIDVSWVDGPLQPKVQEVCDRFRGADFDGMIDLKTYSQHCPVGGGERHRPVREQPEGSGGVIPAAMTDPPDPNARLVSLGADFVFANRKSSPEAVAAALAALEEKLGAPLPADPSKQWSLNVPLFVDRDGTLYKMVDTDTHSLSEVLRNYLAHREG